MADNNNTQLVSFFIPDNIVQSNRVLGFPKRNLIEACIVCAIVIGAVCQVPFVPKVKIIVCSVLGAVLFFVFVNGVKHRSVTEWIMDATTFSSSPAKYHFRPITVKRKISIAVAENGERMSYAELGIKKLKDLIYGTEEDQGKSFAERLQAMIKTEKNKKKG